MVKAKKPGNDARQIQRASLPAQLQEVLRGEIIAGIWEPGQRLPEVALCKRFGVSRTPLREALKALESERMLDLIPGRGATVTAISSEDVTDKMRVLRELEALAVELACEVATTAEIDEIQTLHQNLLETFRHSHGSNDARGFYVKNAAFHRAIVKASHNETLIDMHQHLHRHVERFRHRAGFFDDTASGMEGHHRIVVALGLRDAVAGKQAMSNHIAIIEKQLIEILQRRSADKRSQRKARRNPSRTSNLQ